RNPIHDDIPSFPTRRSSDLNRIPERRLVLPDATWRPSMPIRPWMCWIFLNGELKWLCETVRRCLMSEQSHQVICLKSRRLAARLDRKSTRLNSSHRTISYAV